jgi:hypothetical protein
MKLYWKVRNVDGNLLFATERVADTPENRRNVGKSLRRAYPSSEGFSVARVKVHTDGETAEPDPKSHTLILAVDCGAEGAEEEDMIDTLRAYDGVQDVRIIATEEHEDQPVQKMIAVDLPALLD